MTILDLIPNLKREATTNGGEWAGPCPFCGGKDRFRAWPLEGRTGAFWCRSCGKHGDGLQLIRDLQGLTFPEALRAWSLPSALYHGTSTRTGTSVPPLPNLLRTRDNVTAEKRGVTCVTGPNPERKFCTNVQNPSGLDTWKPRQSMAPGNTWQEKAGAFLQACQRNLAGFSGHECREWLKGRGLKSETIERGGLGWNPFDQYQSREAWGLSPETIENKIVTNVTKESRKPRRIWLPSGLVIPCFSRGRVIRLRIRRPDPGDGPRYVIVTGSASSPLTLGHGMAWVIVESELDALLLEQEAGDLAGVIALGNAQTRPDIETDRALKEAGLILVALDSDQAGAKEVWGFWKGTYPNARRWPCPIGKDPTEAVQQGLDLRAWVMAGLPESSTVESEVIIDPTTEPTQSAATHHQEGTHATKTEKTYKDKGADRRTVFEPFLDVWKQRFDEGTLERLAILTVDGGLTDLESLEVIGQC
jgi:DNA primase